MANISLTSRARHAGPWWAFLAGLAFCGEGLGYAACLLVGAQPPRLAAWTAFAAVAVVAGGVGAAVLNWLVLDGYRRFEAEVQELRQQAIAGQESQRQLAGHGEQQRRLRHDIRGALSPALLTADRLLTHADPAVKRAGEIMVRSVDRAASLLIDPVASPPAGP